MSIYSLSMSFKPRKTLHDPTCAMVKTCYVEPRSSQWIVTIPLKGKDSPCFDHGTYVHIYILYLYYMYTLYVYYICIHMYTPSIVHISTTYLPLREAQSLGGPLFSGTTLVLVASSCASSVPNKPLVSSCDTCTCHICVVCYVLLYFLI